MSVHTIAVLFIFLGLALMLYCVVSAEVCYRKVTRHLAQGAARGSGEQDAET